MFTFTFFSRKRRCSETFSSSDSSDLDPDPVCSSRPPPQQPVMSECTAALVLMKLSVSPNTYNSSNDDSNNKKGKNENLLLLVYNTVYL